MGTIQNTGIFVNVVDQFPKSSSSDICGDAATGSGNALPSPVLADLPPTEAIFLFILVGKDDQDSCRGHTLDCCGILCCIVDDEALFF